MLKFSTCYTLESVPTDLVAYTRVQVVVERTDIIVVYGYYRAIELLL